MSKPTKTASGGNRHGKTNAAKEHRFTVLVTRATSRRCAENALLLSFATRKPDGCEFHILKYK